MRILLVFDPKRKDLFSYLSADKRNEYFLLFYDQPSGLCEGPLAFVRKEFGWSSFTSPFQIVKEISPDRIVFQEVFDLKQIALNIAAKHSGILTLLLDHGIWSEFSEILQEDVRLRKSMRNHKIKKLIALGKVAKGYWFYFSAIKGVSSKNWVRFLRFPLLAFRKSLMEAVNALPFQERKPHRFVLFTCRNYEPLKSYYHFTDIEVEYSGFPYFDAFFDIDEKTCGDYIVFIDHPYLEDRILGWDDAFHRQLANRLLALADSTGLKIQVKLHPRSDANIWRKYGLPADKIELVTGTALTEFYLQSKLIIGYASTLMIAFISARKNVVLVGWHPQPGIFGPDFSVYNVCHKSMSLDEVFTNYQSWVNTNKAKENSTAYESFLQQFNYPFDGRATERVMRAIEADEAP